MRHILVRTDLTPSQPSPQAGRERSLLGRGLLLSVFLFVALVALLSVAAVAGENVWTSNGPYGGVIRALAIDPTNTQTVYAGTLGRGVFEIRFPTILRGVSPDFDGDGSVDFNDFFLFAAAFGKKRSDAGLDAKFELDGDGEVGFSDFFIFAEAFGKQVR